MKKSLLVLGVILIILFGIFALFNTAQQPNPHSQKISVVTTLFPQYDFTRAIGGDKVDVTLLLPPGVESHAFEPKPSDITKINSATIFVYTGEFMEPWVHDIVEGATRKVKAIDASAGVELIKSAEESDHQHEESISLEPEEQHHHIGGIDPHIWLDFDNAKLMAGNIARALNDIDPQHSEYYQKNLDTYLAKLTALDQSYRNTLSLCKTKTIIYGGHYAFGYLAKRYGLTIISAQDFSPDAEPTAKDMIALVEQIKKRTIKYIYYEELTSPKIAETLARETNTKLLILNGAHNLAKEDYEAGVSFITLMENNLKNLSLGLDCRQ